MKILVPYAGSKYSVGVLRMVAQMALNPNSEILVLNVVPDTASPLADDQDKSLRRQQVLKQKTRHVADLAGELGYWQRLCRVTSRVYFGSPETSILSVANEWKADLIIMGANDRSGLKKFIYGSVTRYVIDHAVCSVMIVKPTPEIQQGTFGTNGYKVLLPVQGSVYSYETVSWMADQVWKDGTQFRLLMAVPSFKGYKDGLPTSEDELHQKEQWTLLKEQAFLMLEKHALTLGQCVGNGRVSIGVAPGDAKQAILDTARQWRPDMIAMGSQAPTGLKSMFSDSIPTYVTENSDCAVLIVRRMNGTKPPRAPKSNLDQLNDMINSINFSDREDSDHRAGGPHGSVL